jgi:hypothetical protein
VFGVILHQLFGVATDNKLQQQLRVHAELQDKVAETLTRQVHYEKETYCKSGSRKIRKILSYTKSVQTWWTHPLTTLYYFVYK